MLNLICIICMYSVILGYFSLFLLRRYRLRKLINKIPGPDGNIIFGSALEIFKFKRGKIMESYSEQFRTYGLFVRKWIIHQPIVAIGNAEDAEVLLTCRRNIDKSIYYKVVDRWLGTGLLTSSGSKWAARRKLLTPAFHFTILNTFIDVINENCNIFLDKLETQGNQEFDIHPYISNCALDIICETTMGVKINAQEGNSTYAKGITEMAIILTRRLLTAWLLIDWIYKFSALYQREQKALETIHGFTTYVIKRRIRERKTMETLLKENKEKRMPHKNKALLDLLLDISEESAESLTDSDIKEEVDTFMFEGHDTVTVAVSWAIHLIGSHPNVQEKIFEELNSVFGSSKRPPTRDDIQQLKYLDMVIKECLRLYPPGFVVARTLSSDLTFRDYKVPAGTLVELHIYFVHRDPKHYKNPLSFDPEHFSPENCAKRHPFAFIPFSAGQRNCIGQKFAILEEKILLSSFLRRYKVEALQKSEDLIVLPELVLRPGNGIKVRISER